MLDMLCYAMLLLISALTSLWTRILLGKDRPRRFKAFKKAMNCECLVRYLDIALENAISF